MASWTASTLVSRAAAEGNDTMGEGMMGPIDVYAPVFGIFSFVDLYSGHIDAKRLAFALLAWVVYDFLITIDDSIDLFWGFRWNMSKTLYLVNRYNTVFTLSIVLAVAVIPSPSETFCTVMPWVQLIGTIFIIMTLDLAMITRVYALWNREKWVLVAALTILGLHMVSYITLLAYGYAKGILIPQLPPWTGCMLILGYDKTWIIFVTSLVFEVVVVLLTVYKSWSVASEKGIRTPIYTMLLEDGVIYFSIIIAAHILSFVCVMVPSAVTFPVIGAYPTLSVSGVACGRLFTRLQRLLLSRSKGQSGFSTEAIWTSAQIDFAYHGSTKENEPTSQRPQRSLEAHQPARRNSASNRQHQKTNLDLDEDIGMGPITGTKRPIDQQPIAEETEGDLDQKVGSIRRLKVSRPETRERDRRQVPRGANTVKVEIKVDGEGPGSFMYGDRKSVLDPSPRSPAEQPSSPSHGDDDVGSLIVSRMGRYN